MTVAGPRNDQLRSPATHPFSGTNVWELLNLRARSNPDDPYLVWHPFEGEGRTWTFSDLLRDAASVATGLRRRGVSEGQRIVIHLDNCPEFVIAWFACAAIGAVAVTTNTRSAGDELAFYAADSEAVGAITQPRHAELLSRHASELRWLVSLDHDAGSTTGVGGAPDPASSFRSLLHDPSELERAWPDSTAPMSVQYTSGTTSRPKGVLWTHANALWGAKVSAVHEDLHPDDCHLAYMPLFHTNSLVFSMLASLWVGSRFVLIPKWSSTRFWDISLQHGCTWLSLMTLSTRAVNASDPPDDHQYRLFGSGVCDLPFDQRLGVKTIGWWGMTEMVSHPIVGDPYLPNRPWSMGRPAPEYGIAVVREDGVTPVEPEEPGELLVKGSPGLSIFAGYLNQPDLTADSFDELGWFRTGDRVVPHADGHLSYVERSRDAMKVGAENVAASEVERVITSVPGVEEAAVVGRPDDKLDEVPVAFVVAPAAAADLASVIRARCAEMLADFKVPREVHVVRELPRATLHKINKRALREVAAPGADLAAAERRWLADASIDPSGDAV